MVELSNKPKKKRKSKEKILSEEREKETKKLLFDRANNQCEKCGRSGKYLQWAHIEGRNPKIKYDLDNLLLLCAKCHMWFDNSSNRYESMEFLKTKRSEEQLKRLLYLKTVDNLS